MRHVCRLPTGLPVGTMWTCPGCWSEFILRTVRSAELSRPINLWVREYEPPLRTYVEPGKRNKRKRGAVRYPHGRQHT